ncbi:MAG: PAS domain S-box protein [Thermoplasmatales archaeon]|nr:PAS domain S-box protein [Thermoplasmatales archaeon]
MDEKEIPKFVKNEDKICKLGKRYYSVKKINEKNGKILLVEDVTEKIIAENALKNSEKTFRTICENSLIGIIILKNKKPVYINKRFSEIIGYERKKIEKNFFELIHEDDIKKFWKIIEDGVSVIRFFDKNNRIRWFEMCGCEIEYRGNAHLLNAIDITKKKEMEMKLRESNEKMRKTLEKEKRFLEEISHYFFNPLCIAKGYLDLSIPCAEESLRRKLEITKEAIIRVENVVKHIVMEGKIYE